MDQLVMVFATKSDNLSSILEGKNLFQQLAFDL